MLADILARIESRLAATNQSPSGASRKAGLGEDAIRNMQRAMVKDDRQGVSTRTLELLAPVLGTTAAWLLEGVGPEHEPLVPVIGLVGANPDGLVLLATGDSPNELAPIPPGGTALARALRVVGHSMRGLADDGALIYFEDQRTPPTPDMLGHVVVIETDTDEVLVKRLLRGERRHHFDLESLSGPTRQNVALRWAAHISAIIPPYMARRIIRHASEAA